MTIKHYQRLYEAATEPPDGGWGWMITLGVFLIGFFTWGVFVAYPVFYQPLMDEFHISLGDVSWISGVHEIGRAFGHLTMPLLSKRHDYRLPSIFVSLISAIGISVSGYMSSPYLVYLLLSFIPGLALGNLTVSSFVMIARYFYKKKYLALGLAQAGVVIGTLCLAPLFQFFVDFYGMSGTLLLTGGLSLHCVVASALLRPIRLISDQSSEYDDKTPKTKTIKKLLKMPKFWVAVFILLCMFGSLRTYLAFVVSLGNTFADADNMKSSLLLSLYCGITLIAQILAGAVGDLKTVNMIWLLLIAAVFATVSIATVWFVSSYVWLFVNCAVVAIVTSTCHIMVVPIVAAAVGESNLQWGISLSGFTYTIIGAGIIPLTGYVIDICGNVRVGYIIAASFMLIGSLLHIPLLIKKKETTAPI